MLAPPEWCWWSIACLARKLHVKILVYWIQCPALPERVMQNRYIKCLDCDGFLPCLKNAYWYACVLDFVSCPAWKSRAIDCHIQCLEFNEILPCLKPYVKLLVYWIQCPALPERVVQKLSDQMSQVQWIPALPESDMSKFLCVEFSVLPCLKESCDKLSYQMSRPRWIPALPKNWI